MKINMKFKMLTIALLAGFISLSAQAGFEQFPAPAAESLVWQLAAGPSKGAYAHWQGSSLADMQAITTDNRTFEFKPNISLYGDGSDSFWANTNALDGAKWLTQTMYFRIHPVVDEDVVTMDFTVTANDLDARYEFFAFVEVLDPGNDWQAGPRFSFQPITGPGTYSVTWARGAIDISGMAFQAGFRMEGPNASTNTDWGSVELEVTSLDADTGDFTAPTPNPMTFAAAPYAISDSAISVTATTAIDDLSGVEYKFINTVNSTDSGWQSSPTWIDAGPLDIATLYTYVVVARDTSLNLNETGYSAPASATTFTEDTDAPLPEPMTFAATDASPLTVKLTATTATDASWVEYYFACTAGGGSDSGWQFSPVYYDTGLTPDTTYSYTVIARDTSVAQNSNTLSAVTSITTMAPASGSFTNILTGFTGNSDDMDVVFQLEKAGLETGSVNADATIDFDGSGATFGDGSGFAGRDLLKTIATGYQNVSFEAYATLTFAGQSDLSGFLGMGQGIQTGVPDNYSVPELNLGGVNGVVAQFKDTTAGDIPNSQLFRIIDGNPADNGGTNIVSAPIGSIETIRARLIYDAVAETVNVAYTKNYTGGAFVADQDMGTVSTSLTDTNAVAYSMWDDAPVRVYVGGGEGTIVSDFEIVVTSAPHPEQPEFGVQVADIVAGEAVFSWVGVAGRTYDVQYKTNLVTDVTWMTDPSLGASDILSTGGAVSATSTVNAASVFYRIISQ